MTDKHVPSNDEFWTSPEKVRLAIADYINNETPTSSILGPSEVDRNAKSTIPVILLQGGGFEEFRLGSISSQGTMALIDLDRNTLQIDPVDKSEDESDDEPDDKARQPTGSRYALESVPVDLAERFFPDLPHTAGRYRLVALLWASASSAHDFRVGPPGPDFERELSLQLGTIPERRTIPQDLLQDDHPWKALAAPPSLREGLRASLPTESQRVFLEVDFALPELRGERLHLEPGAILPSGNRPPDAVKWIHILAAGEDQVHHVRVLLPVFAYTDDALLRGHARIDLERLFPGISNGGTRSIYVFSGSSGIGPLVLSPGKP